MMESSDCWICDSLKNFHPISPVVQTLLKEVYFLVCFLLIGEALGSYFHVLWNIGGLLTTIATFGCMLWLHYFPPHEKPKGVTLLMTSNLLWGTSVGPIINFAIDIDTRLLVSLFMGGAIVYACFSLAAMLARRRGFLYLGSLLSSVVSIFFWLHFASRFFGVDVVDHLYLGLLVFVGCIVVQTQFLIYEFEGEDEEEQEEQKVEEEEDLYGVEEYGCNYK